MQCDPLTPQEVQALTTVLQKLRKELDAQATLIEPATKPVSLDQQSVGRLSRMDAIAQQQMDSARAHQCVERLRAVTVALSWVESGDYGYCRECDEPIGYARLAAKPEAGLCLACQQKQEEY
jgi:DnaK suppressor protein